MSKRGRRVGGRLKMQQRKQKCQRENAAHRHSRKLADTAHTVVLKDLNTKGMTASAKGTVEEPGRNVRQKAGLNREILKSTGAGWNGAWTTRRGRWCGWIRPPRRGPARCADTSAGRIAGHRRTFDARRADTPQTRTAIPPKTSWRRVWPCARRPAGQGLLHGERRSIPVRCLWRRSNQPQRPEGMPSLPRGSPPGYTGI